MHQIGEVPTCLSSMPPATTRQPSHPESSALPPVMLNSCLPPVPAKLVQRIQDGLFIEMGELSPKRLDSPDHLASDQPPSSHKVQEVTNIIEWVQCFSVFIAIIHRSQPERTPDLLGYQNLIVQTSQICQEGHWVVYDQRFRLKASAQGLHQWSTIDITVWSLTFPETSPKSVPLTQAQQHATQRPSRRPTAMTRPICLDWNDTPSPKCPHRECKFEHICYRCAHNYSIVDKAHKAMFCPNKPKQPQPLMGQPNTS